MRIDKSDTNDVIWFCEVLLLGFSVYHSDGCANDLQLIR